MKRKHEDSAGDSMSSSSDSEMEEARKVRKRASPKRRCIRGSNTSMKDCALITKQNLAIKSSLDSCIDVGNPLSLSKQSTNDTNSLGTLGYNKNSAGINIQRFLCQTDSGISSQEAASSQEFCFSDIKPAMLTRMNAQVLYVDNGTWPEELLGTGKNYNQLKPSPLSATSSNCSLASVESGCSVATLRQTASDSESNTKQLQQQQLPLKSQLSSQNSSSSKDSDDSTICSLCFDNEKSAVFVHTTKACSGCCYTCAMKTWKKWKVCPFCKDKAKNVIKLYSH